MPTHLTRSCALFIPLVLLTLLPATVSALEIRVTGTVLTPNGRPAEDAHVIVVAYVVDGISGLRGVHADTDTDDAGEFTLTLDAEGDLLGKQDIVVSAMAEDFGLGWVVTPPTQTANLTIRLNDEVLSIGRVVDEEGQPIEDAEVEATVLQLEPDDRDFTTKTCVSACTDEKGRFEIAGLPRGGRAYLKTKADGYQPAYVPPRQCETLTNETIVLLPATSITGTVTCDGHPVEGVVVVSMASPPTEGGVGFALTDEDGVYTIGNLPPGTYMVYITHLMPTAPRIDKTAVARSGVVCAAGAPATGIDLELIDGATIRGTLRDKATRERVAHGRIKAYVADGTWERGIWEAVTSKDGVFILRLPAGTYRVYGAAPGYRETPDADAQRVTVDDGQNLDRINLAIEAKVDG